MPVYINQIVEITHAHAHKMHNDQRQSPVKIDTDDVDYMALQQLENIAQLPFIHSHIAARFDVTQTTDSRQRQ